MTRIVLGLFLDCHQFGCCIGFVGSCQSFSSLSSKFPKLFPMFVQSSLFCFFMSFVSSSLHSNQFA